MKPLQLPEEPSDPHLQAAMEEIKAILKKVDCAGIVILQSKTHSEHLLHLTPSWSLMFLEKMPDGAVAIRVKAPLKTGTTEQKEKGNLSVGLVMGFLDVTEFLSRGLKSLAMDIGRKVEIQHISSFTPRKTM